MAIKLLDIVRLKRDDLEHDVKASYIGTVVDVQEKGKYLCIEFLDEDGETVEKALNHYYSSKDLELC